MAPHTCGAEHATIWVSCVYWGFCVSSFLIVVIKTRVHSGFSIYSCFERRKSRSRHKILVKFCNTVGSATHAGGRIGYGALLMPVDLELSGKHKKKKTFFFETVLQNLQPRVKRLTLGCSLDVQFNRRVEETLHHVGKDLLGFSSSYFAHTGQLKTESMFHSTVSFNLMCIADQGDQTGVLPQEFWSFQNSKFFHQKEMHL